ncbi:MAG: hypothetical protein V1740_06135 [Candidatus Woesearchaeota archaeon]
MITSNSSPLILLAKINKLELLKILYKEIHVPNEVYTEVIVRGKEEQYADAFLIEKQINDFIFVKELNQKNKKESEKLGKILGSGESESIVLALQENSRLLLIDNLEPRKIAELKKIKCRSTPGVLLEALNKRVISAEEYRKGIKKLSEFAWLSGDIVAYFIEESYKNKCGEKNENK